MRIWLRVILAVACFTVTNANAISWGDKSSRPENLLIFYGWPSLINGSNGDMAAAVSNFARYDYVVLGDGLQDASHGDHASTRQIISSLASDGVIFFGYIDLGVTTNNYSIGEIQARAAAWADMNVHGVLLDDYGYDYGVTRERQNAAVLAVRSYGLRVIANGFHVDDVFSSEISSGNINGVPTVLNEHDFYLYESHGIRLGVQENPSSWHQKSMKLKEYRNTYHVGVLSVTTPDSIGTFDDRLWSYAYYAAALFDHTATGWGELWYGAAQSLAPFRAPPDIDSSPFITGLSFGGGAYWIRATCDNQVWINTVIVTSGQNPVSSCGKDAIFKNGFEL